MNSSFDPLDFPQAFMTPKRLSDMPHWHRHIPFASALVGILRPRVLVELGAFKGDSYAAMCQSVDELDLSTRCYAVDTWQGDGHVGDYSNEIYLALSQFNALHHSRFSTLMRMPFDDAKEHFSPGSIDLLHIDGFHTEEAVAHDFATWKDRLSDRGVVIFHDVNSRLPEFGVWKVWERLCKDYPHFTFPFGHGLGVLGVGAQQSDVMRALFSSNEADTAAIVRFYHALGDRIYFLGQNKNSLTALPSVVVQREMLVPAVNELASRYSHAESERKRIESDFHVARQEVARLTDRSEAFERDQARLEHQVTALEKLRLDGQQRESELATEAATLRLIRAERDAMVASYSWRATAWLRWLVRRFVPREKAPTPAQSPIVASAATTTGAVRAIAFYLPQFHPIEENDRWWGKGFTEWRNVSKAKPNFRGHAQPLLPADLGFYDLRLPASRAAQADLAKASGIHGFCYYYYWFNGRRLLSEPLDAVLASGEPDFPFCICWANEGWTRTWDGAEKDSLIPQQHSIDDSRAFIHALFPYFRDARYIRVNGAPLLAIYRVGLIPDIVATTAMWRDECRAAGIGEIHLVAVQSFGLTGDPRDYGFDAALEIPPHGTDMAWNSNAEFAADVVNPEFTGNIVDIGKVIAVSEARAVPEYTLYRGVMPRWDNTARRQNNPLIFSGTTAARYERWLRNMVAYTKRVQPDPDKQLIFVNAWNEWAEGAQLEPDLTFGHAYLDATRRALDETSRPNAEGDETLVDPLAATHAVPSVGLKRHFHALAHALYRAVPLTTTAKIGVAHWSFSHFGRLFSGTAAYANWAARHRRGALASTPVPVPEPTPVVGASVEDRARALTFDVVEDPTVTIVIPVYNQIDYTLTCLASIQINRPETTFEIIVIDDCSTDETSRALALVQGITVIRNETNMGFLRNCNKAAAIASGRYLMFLNNDTEVRPRWLDELVDVLENDTTVGLVGSKLLFSNGLLQEAGGIIWSDASGLNFGRGDDPRRPEYNFVCDVDYVSGASILIAKHTFERLGCFDERYVPAYYEDTDLAFAVRQAGLRVVYQPFSEVIHHEGITSGTDVTKGTKAYQLVNQKKFLEKWTHVLRNHGGPGSDAQSRRARAHAKQALVLDVVTPLPDQDSGSIDTLNYMRLLQVLGYKVTFLPDQLAHHGRYTEDLQRLGIDAQYEPYIEDGAAFLESRGKAFDLVLLNRAPYAAKYIDDVRRCCPKALVLFNTVDLHFLREMRQAELEGSRLLQRMANHTKSMEISVMERADATIVISEEERDFLSRECPYIRTYAIPYIREIVDDVASIEGRRDVTFIGGFRHLPNVDAIEYFIDEIWPLVHARLPEARFRIIGSNMSDELRSRASRVPNVVVDGFVPDLSTVLDVTRLSVAPLRFGAGIKGKVGTSLAYGVPCVLTNLAAEGMGLVHGENALVADAPIEFANEIVRVYEDDALWERLSRGGRELMQQRYSFKSARDRFQAVIDDLEKVRDHAEPRPIALRA